MGPVPFVSELYFWVVRHASALVASGLSLCQAAAVLEVARARQKQMSGLSSMMEICSLSLRRFGGMVLQVAGAPKISIRASDSRASCESSESSTRS